MEEKIEEKREEKKKDKMKANMKMEGIGIFLTAFVPWFWAAHSTDYVIPYLGLPLTRITIAITALVVFFLGIRVTKKGYGI